MKSLRQDCNAEVAMALTFILQICINVHSPDLQERLEN